MVEYQLVAHAERIFADGGASGGAYRAIVACGENIWNAHYFRNNAVLEDGQLVLMDYAPDFRGYTSDIGRMWPVSGTYDALQQELYGFIVEYHKVLLDHIRPGITTVQVMEEAAGVMRPIVESTSWSSDAYRQAARETLTFQGHLSHGVGMAVHDVGDYRRLPLRPGVVFALDPQLWVPSEQIYVRVEDTVAVTGTGMEVLTGGVPLELEETEQQVGVAMASRE
jgi:Xaa-Pro aminopeptidase